MRPNATLILLIGLSLCAWAHAEQATDQTYQAAAKYKFGDSRKDLSAIEADIRSAPREEYKQIEGKILPLLKSPDTALDAKRYFCRYLATVGSAEAVPVLASDLEDKDLSDLARIALEAIPDPSAGQALRDSLNKLKGRLLMGAIGSVSAKREELAVPRLITLASDADQNVAACAIAALGHIASPEAAKALDALATRNPESVIVAKAQISCAEQMGQAGHKPEAIEIYKRLLDPNFPKAQRLAALKGTMALMDRDEAVNLAAKSLQSGDPIMRVAALSSFVMSSDAAFKSMLVAQLPKLNPEGQMALLPVVAQDSTPAHEVLMELLNDSKNQGVRVAALEALPPHSEASDVTLVLSIALKADSETEKSAARRALAHLGKPGVNDALIALIDSRDQATREVVVNALAERHAAAAIAPLMKLAAGSDPEAAADAVKSLEILGTGEQVPELVTIIAKTGDENLRATAQRVAGILFNRSPDKKPGSDALVAAIRSADSDAAKSALIRLLPRARTQEALAAAVEQARGDNAAAREAAIRALADWPDIAAAPELFSIAQNGADQKLAILAMQGALRLAGMKDAPAGIRVETYRRVLEMAKRAEEKKQALAGLAELPTPLAIKTLKQYANDADLGSDAQQALKRLSTAGINKDGLILSYALSGPYMEKGKNGQQLFDVPFAPEKSPSQADWRLAISQNGMIELDRVIGGNDRVAYLLATLNSPTAQDATLSVGSDDGIKVFVNGKVVLANNATRPAQPDQDKATIHLNEGANTLLLKIVQGGGQWAAIARLRTTDNKPLNITLTPGAD